MGRWSPGGRSAASVMVWYVLGAQRCAASLRRRVARRWPSTLSARRRRGALPGGSARVAAGRGSAFRRPSRPLCCGGVVGLRVWREHVRSGPGVRSVPVVGARRPRRALERRHCALKGRFPDRVLSALPEGRMPPCQRLRPVETPRWQRRRILEPIGC